MAGYKLPHHKHMSMNELKSFLNPKDIYALFYLGSIYQEEGLTNFAQENYRKILEISPRFISSMIKKYSLSLSISAFLQKL